MKLKQLEGLLGDLQQFPNPKIELEQYPTVPHIASRMLYTLRYDVPQLYKFHKKREVDIAVDLWRFTPRSSKQ